MCTWFPSVHCLTRCGGGQWGSICGLPHCMGKLAVGFHLYSASLHGAMGSGDPFGHCLTAGGRGEGLILYTAAVRGRWAVGILRTLHRCMGH